MMKGKLSICILFVIVALFGCDYRVVENEEFEAKVKEVCEMAYFEGQRDALIGDIRIKLNKDSTLYWVKSPWDSGDKPSYKPTYLDTRDGN